MFVRLGSSAPALRPLSIAVALCACLPGSARAEQMRIVAVVNEEVITQSELDQAFAPVYMQMQNNAAPEELAEKAQQMRQQMLEQLIEEKLLSSLFERVAFYQSIQICVRQSV